MIKKRLLDRVITEGEAAEQTTALAGELRKKYNPTQEELDEAQRQWQAREAAEQPAVFRTPSLFDA